VEKSLISADGGGDLKIPGEDFLMGGGSSYSTGSTPPNYISDELG